MNSKIIQKQQKNEILANPQLLTLPENEQFLDDQKLMYRVFKQTPYLYHHLSPQAQRRENVANIVFNTVTDNNKKIPEIFLKNENFIFTIMKTYPFIFTDAHESLCAQPSFCQNGLQSNWVVMESVELEKKFSYFKKTSEFKNYKQQYLAIREKLFEAGIQRYDRFKNIYQAEEIYNNLVDLHNNVKTEHQRIILCFTRRPWIDYFYIQDQITALIERNFAVLYFELENRADLYQAIKEAGRNEKIDFLIIGGSGNSKEILFSERQEYISTLDFSAEHEIREQALQQYFSKNSSIALESCQAGEGGKQEKNMANFFSKLFPLSTIITPRELIRGLQFVFDPENRLPGINFVRSTELVDSYIVNPKHKK